MKRKGNKKGGEREEQKGTKNGTVVEKEEWEGAVWEGQRVVHVASLVSV